MNYQVEYLLRQIIILLLINNKKIEGLEKNQRKNNRMLVIGPILSIISILMVLPFFIDVSPNDEALYVPVSDPASATDSVVATIGQTPSELNHRIAQDVTVFREAFTPNGGIVITVHDQYGKLNDFSIA